MTRKFLILVVLLALGFFGYRFYLKKNNTSDPPPKPLEISSNTTTFSGQFTRVLHAYYQLRDAMVKSDTSMTNKASSLLSSHLDSLDLKELKADTSLISTAKNLKLAIATEVKAIVKTNDMEKKRKSFQVASDAMFDLIRTVKYDKEMIYQLHCPMAFENTGANWLSDKSDIINPYFGEKMLHCGEVQDSVDYRPAPPVQKQ